MKYTYYFPALLFTKLFQEVSFDNKPASFSCESYHTKTGRIMFVIPKEVLVDDLGPEDKSFYVNQW